MQKIMALNLRSNISLKYLLTLTKNVGSIFTNDGIDKPQSDPYPLMLDKLNRATEFNITDIKFI